MKKKTTKSTHTHTHLEKLEKNALSYLSALAAHTKKPIHYVFYCIARVRNTSIRLICVCAPLKRTLIKLCFFFFFLLLISEYFNNNSNRYRVDVDTQVISVYPWIRVCVCVKLKCAHNEWNRIEKKRSVEEKKKKFIETKITFHISCWVGHKFMRRAY